MSFLLFCLFFLAAGPARGESFPATLRLQVIQADLTTGRSLQKKRAEEAIRLAEECLRILPREAACYYYRGQAKGLRDKNVLLGYPGRVRSMLADWKKAMELNPSFDHGGPYRMFAEVYTALPKHFGPKDLRQNLKLALEYLEKAIKISDYPTNHLDKAEALLKAGRKDEAIRALNRAREHLPLWSSYPYYHSWLETAADLENRLRP